MRLAMKWATPVLMWLTTLPAHAQALITKAYAASDAASGADPNATPGIPITWFFAGLAVGFVVGYVVGKNAGSKASSQ